MREGFRDALLFLGVMLAGLQVWQGRNNPQPQVHLVSLYVIATLFILAGGLNLIPFLIRHFRHAPIMALPTNGTPLEDQIEVHIEGTAFSVIGDKASLELTFFSAQSVELKFCRVRVSERTDGGFILESAEPLEIPVFKKTRKKLERSLTPDEQQRHGGTRGGRLLLVQGSAKFSGNVEKKFNQMIVEYL